MMYDSKNKDVLDALSEAIQETINHFLITDPHYNIAPYFYDGEIGTDCTFFADNRITLAEFNSSDDLKTISYLAPFYRNRIAYNPKNMDFYLRCIGHLSYSESAMDIVCYDKSTCGEEANSILYKDWLLLD